MDLGTSLAIIGGIAATVYIVETVGKYGSALLKKRSLAREKTSRRALGLVGKNIIAMLDPVRRQILLADPDTINPANLNRYACPQQYLLKKP